MTGRAIVRAPDGQAITWVIDGTLIRVADLKRDYQSAGSQVFPVYRAMGLTDSEINAALTFHFPPVRDTTLDVRRTNRMRLWANLARATSHSSCRCGERRPAAWPGGRTISIAPRPGSILAPCVNRVRHRFAGPNRDRSGSAVGRPLGANRTARDIRRNC
jgi:hypothetical protein